MSIRPIAFDESTKIYTMVHEEEGHVFDVLLADLTFILDGTEHKFMRVNCGGPDCTASSFHPVAGGADPSNVQQLFVNKIVQAGCACGNVEAGNEILADAHAHLNCARMDGEERWQV